MAPSSARRERSPECLDQANLSGGTRNENVHLDCLSEYEAVSAKAGSGESGVQRPTNLRWKLRLEEDPSLVTRFTHHRVVSVVLAHQQEHLHWKVSQPIYDSESTRS